MTRLTAEEIASGLGGKRGKHGWKAPCPAHDDSDPSLQISETEDGKVLVHCFAGCTQESVIAALREKDLWSEEGPSGLTRQEYAAAKGLGVDFLEGEGIRDHKYFGTPAVRIPYYSGDGRELAVRYRLSLGKGTGADNRFRWQKGSKVHLYGLNHLEHAREEGYIILVEGESDTQTLWQAGFPAAGVPGADTWQPRWAEHFEGIERIYIVVEPDQGGAAVLSWLGISPIRDRAFLLDLGEHKDPSAFYLADTSTFVERMNAAIAAAKPWQAVHEKQRTSEAETAFEQCRELAHDPALLERIGEAIRKRGYAGDLRLPVIVYVALTSRLLERPQNTHLVAPSAAGKSHAVDTARELVPEDAYYLIRAGSARALVYNEETFEHRFVIVGEADSIPEDGPAASAMRSIASDNEMSYEVTERDEETGHFTTRRIVKPGPTGLITTSTRSMGDQMSTRVLELSVPDDATQTRAVLRAHAFGVSGEAGPRVDLRPFLALQQWLTLAGNHSVVIPFAGILADELPEQAVRSVRMRRDFRQLLTCVQAIALLYQAQRETDEAGRIVATIEDYARAYELLEPIFTTITAEGVTPAIRETVAAVKQGETVSQAELCERLGLSKNTVSWRVRKALKDGWLVNMEERRGHPHKLALGTPLPEDRPALPSPERVREVYECTNANREETPPPPSYTGNGQEKSIEGVFHTESDSYTRTPPSDADDDLDLPWLRSNGKGDQAADWAYQRKGTIE